MARGITSFRAYRKEQGPWGTRYSCFYCLYFFIGQHRFHGNALGRHSKSVGLMKRHVEEHHPEKMKPRVETSAVQCPGCGANQTDENGACHWCRTVYRAPGVDK